MSLSTVQNAQQQSSHQPNANTGRFSTVANNFYWIAGLSLVNAVAYFFGSQWQMVIGLGATQVLSVVIKETTSIARTIAVIITLFFIGLFWFFGNKARNDRRWAVIAGGIVYALDLLVLVLAGDVLGIVFHLWILLLIFKPLFGRPAEQKVVNKMQKKGKLVFQAATDHRAIPVTIFAFIMMVAVLYIGKESTAAITISGLFFFGAFLYSWITSVKVILRAEEIELKYFRKAVRIRYDQIRAVKKVDWSVEFELRQTVNNNHILRLALLGPQPINEFIHQFEDVSGIHTKPIIT